MAQLPPKIPTITQNWPSLPHKRIPSTMPNLTPTNHTPNAQQSPSWVDEFLHFSSTRRGAHRRSASDSMAFLETPFLEECRSSTAAVMPSGAHGFDRLDDDQLLSMFSADIASVDLPLPSPPSNSSTPSEQNSNNDEKQMRWDVPLQDDNNNNQQQQQPKNESEEVDSSCKNETPAPPPSATPCGGETITDPKRVKR